MILITGASGFVGRRLVSALARRQPSTRLRLFDSKPFPDASLPSIDQVCGSVEDPVAVASAMKDVTHVVHLAAKVTPDAKDIHALERANVLGTRNVVQAAADVGCGYLLHVSSAGVYGPPRAGPAFLETDTPNPRSPYQLTKLQAEREIEAIAQDGVVWNIVRPAGIYGAGSHLELPAYRRIQQQRIAIETKGGVVVHPTHVSDVVGALIALLEQPAPRGAIFNVAGERPMLTQDFHALVAEALGHRRRRIIVPPAILAPVVIAATPLLRLRRADHHLSAFARGHVHTVALDDSAFRKRYPAVAITPVEEGVRDHIGWAREHALLR